MTILKIISATLSVDSLTIYDSEGNSIVFKQGDIRINTVMDHIVNDLNNKGYAYLDIDKIPGNYKDFSSNTGGAIKFYRVLKSKVLSWFKPDINTYTNTESSEDNNLKYPIGKYGNVDLDTAIKDIMEHSTNPDNLTNNLAETTVVAVVEHENNGTDNSEYTKTILPGVDQIDKLINHANHIKKYKGLETLIKRLSIMIHERNHNIEDVLTFLERSDLPIADDGSIIAYKVLNKSSKNGSNTYVDVHTGNVKQNVGTKVQIGISMVDPDRKVECSYGLHVARRRFIQSFTGTDCFLVKVNPEDIIAVPYNDPDKVRVTSYTNIIKLDHEEMKLVSKDISLDTVPSGKIKLANAISGNHIKAFNTVTITGPQGTGLIYSKDTDGDINNTPTGNNEVNKDDIDKAISVDNPDVPIIATRNNNRISKEEKSKLLDTQLSKLDQNKTMTKNNSNKSAVKLSSADKIKNLLFAMQNNKYKYPYVEEIINIKRKMKVSWAKLNIDSNTQAQIEDIFKAGPNEQNQQNEQADSTQSFKVPESVKHIATTDTPQLDKDRSDPTKPVESAYDLKAHVANIFEVLQDDSKTLLERQDALESLSILKAKSRVSWERMGINPSSINSYADELKNMEKALKNKQDEDSSTSKLNQKPKLATLNEQARSMFKVADWQSLKLLKAKRKISWERMGFNAKEIEYIKSKI